MKEIGSISLGGHKGSGQIACEGCNFHFRLVHSGSTNPNAPAFRIVTARANAPEIVIGSAWEKTMIRGPGKGRKFLTLTFKAPDSLQRLNVAAFPNREPGQFTITYRTRQKRAA